MVQTLLNYSFGRILIIPCFALFLSLFNGSVLMGSPTGSDQLRGTILDAKTGEPLQAATVQIEGTFRGTITNANGEFELTVPSFPTTILIRFIGYTSRTVTLESLPGSPLQIDLMPVPVSMREIVVTREDPAIEIMREVIRRKKIWRDELENFISDAYSRQRLENDSGIVTITESASRVYWDKRRGIREVIKSRTQTSNIDPTQNFASATNLPNFYDDDISISGFELVGVTHPNALSYYHFKLEGFRQLDDKTVFDISVTPRRRLQPTFEGKIAILDEDFAMIEVDLRPSDAMMFPPPIQEFGLAYQQQFSNFGRDFWLPVDVRINGTIRIGFPGLQFPTINFAQLSRLTNYEVNTVLPDSLFEIQRRVSLDTLSIKNEASRERIVTMRVPLDERENLAYESLDSTQTIEKAFRPTGALSRFVDMDDDDSRRNQSRMSRMFGGALDGLDPVLGYNRVDAARLGLKYELPTRRKDNKRYLAGVNATYLTGTDSFDYGISAGMNRWGSYIRTYKIQYQYQTRHVFTQSMFEPLMTSFTALMAAPDYHNYYKSEEVSIATTFRKRRTTNTWGAQLAIQSVRSLDKTTNYSIPGGYIQRENPPIDSGTDHYVEISFKRGSLDAPFGIIGSRQIDARIRQGSSLFGGGFDYTRLLVTTDWRFDTFYKRRFMPNTLDFRFVGGTALGTLPYHLWNGGDTSLRHFGPFGTIKTQGNLPYESEHSAVLAWEHNFRTIPFEAIGLMGVAKKGMGIIVHGAHGYFHSDSDRFRARYGSIPPTNGTVHELGVSLNGVFSLLRIDVTRQLNGDGFFAGVSVARIF